MDRYAVFGNPIAQSKSPEIHANFAKQTDQDILYTKELIPQVEFEIYAKRFFDEGGKGLNVTVPFKEDAFRFADELTDRAKAAGAVNTLAIRENVTVLGDNTDGAGLVFDIKRRLGWEIKHKNLLILGAGGAVKGVLLPFLNELPSLLTIANRTAEKAALLANKFNETTAGIVVHGCGYSELEGQSFDLIINGTSASLGGDVPPIPTSCLNPNFNAYDMVYGAEPTPFMKWANDQNAKHVSDGYGMLLCQAAESFYLWRGVRPEV